MDHKYTSIMSEVSLPSSERRAISVGHGGLLRIPRNYHLTIEKLTALNALIQEGGSLNPFRRGGAYWGICEALNSLGLDKKHLFRELLDSMQEVMSEDSTKLRGSTSNAWERFVSRSPRSPESGRDLIQKVIENCEVLQRLRGNNPYGMKLLQLGAVINIFNQDDTVMVEMSTSHSESILPINERRGQRKSGAVDIRDVGVPYCIINTFDLSCPVTKNI